MKKLFTRFLDWVERFLIRAEPPPSYTRQEWIKEVQEWRALFKHYDE